MSAASLAVVIVTWNQTDLTLDCLASLAEAGIDLAGAWVVDNGSSPEALPRIRERFPQIRAINLGRNLGFASGSNAGARAALAAGADELLFLNNDARVEAQTVPVLQEALASDGRVGAASPKVYYAGTPRIIQSAGIQVDAESGHGRMIGSGEVDRGQHDQRADREALYGCALLVRRAAWEQVGEFWEPFFSYAEETDWCLRARRLGWRLLYEPRSVVWHRTSSSLGSDSPLKVYLIARNQWYLRRRNRRKGLPAWRGLAYGLYVDARTWLRYVRLGQLRQAQALALGLWDYARGRSGDARAADLRLRAGNG